MDEEAVEQSATTCSERECTNPCTRLKDAWTPLCDECFVQGGYSNYNYPDDHEEQKAKERFPEKHRGLKKCPCRRCHHSSQLIIVYDDEDDEWLFCANCHGFKQLLRVWNKVTNSMVDSLDRPILRWRSTRSNRFREPDTSEESDASRTESDDDSFSCMKDAGMTDGSDDSDHSNEGSDEENPDIPYPEPIVYQIVSKANGKKGKAINSAVSSTTATPTATKPPPLISSHSPIPPPQQLLDAINRSDTSGKLESSSEIVLNGIPSASENQTKSGNQSEESVKQSNQEDQSKKEESPSVKQSIDEELSKKEEQANKEELPLPPPANPTPAIVAPPPKATPAAGIPKPTHIPVTAESLAAARLKVAAEKKAIADATAAKLAEEERKKAEKITLERKKKEDAAALEMEKKLEHDPLVAAEAAKKLEMEQKKAAERKKKAEEDKKAKAEQEALIQKLLDDKKAKKEAIAQKKREEEEQKAKHLAAEKKATDDANAAARKKAMMAETRTTSAVAPIPATGGGGGGGGTSTSVLEDKDPDDYCCPVSLVLMQDPVVAADGITYDRSTIQGWFDNCVQYNKPATSPITSVILPHTHLIPNNALKNLIDNYRKIPKGK